MSTGEGFLLSTICFKMLTFLCFVSVFALHHLGCFVTIIQPSYMDIMDCLGSPRKKIHSLKIRWLTENREFRVSVKKCPPFLECMDFEKNEGNLVQLGLPLCWIQGQFGGPRHVGNLWQLGSYNDFF